MVTLDKDQLLLELSADEYFSNPLNIKEVQVYYKSQLGNQKKRLSFNFSLESPSSDLTFHERARSSFFISKITIISNENERKKLYLQDITPFNINME